MKDKNDVGNVVTFQQVQHSPDLHCQITQKGFYTTVFIRFLSFCGSYS